MDALHVALVEDDASLRENLSYALGRAGFRVEAFADGLAAWEAWDQGAWPEVAVVDVTMPRLDGLDLCRRVRARGSNLGWIFLTSRDEELDRILGLELGADDYLGKPFSVRELEARIKALARRRALPGAEKPEDSRRRGELRLDPSRVRAWWQDRDLGLTLTEFRLVMSLTDQPGVVKTRAQLEAAAYPEELFVGERTMDTHVKRLRRKLADAGCPPLLETVVGLGYRWKERL